MIFPIIVAASALAAGAIAAVSGFGIGSVLTPVFSLHVETRIAVAAVSIPHFTATALRLWMLRSHIDRNVFLRFGLLSAAGGLVGAFLHTFIESPVLTIIFSLLLLFAGTMGVTGISERVRFGHRGVWVAGALSGIFGGLVGNQGGIRASAMLSLDLRRDSFIA